METIELQYDKTIRVATALNRKSKRWENKKVKWSALVAKLCTPIVTSETYAQFMAASKDEQGAIKDVGGFVGGYLEGGKRDKESVKARQVVSLDIDNSTEDLFWNFTMLYNCAAVIHSTHKSSPKKPRHRLVIPLDREVTPDEYQAIARRIASDLDIDLFDQTTFDINRLMYWPTVSRDVEFYSEYQDGPFLSADQVLSTYDDWHDSSQWPVASDFDTVIARALKKQEDPENKKGLIGCFCRAYTIQEAIEKFLPDVYDECDTEGRYTYKNGSTSGGLVIYNDKFAYSHHDTDPAGNRLCNAFDLVRIHLYGELDTDKEKGKPDTERKSYKAMEEMISQDERTKLVLAEERLSGVKADFDDNLDEWEGSEEKADTDWMADLDTDNKGVYKSSADNICLVLENDKYLKGAFRLNVFDHKKYIVHPVPWRKVSGVEPFSNVDDAGIRNYFERVYGIVANQKIDDAVSLALANNSWHPIKDYIEGTTWDGQKRIDTLLQEYFGADDNAYTSAIMRKMLCAAVARVFNPGQKFDLSLILVGPQGTYKSTFVKKLGGRWFSDTFTTVQGRESFEQIRGFWIIEMAELSGLRKSDIETIKLYISKQRDSYRPAYGREVETYERQCVFFGTTNSYDFLRDPTGNRRFCPIDVHPDKVKKSVIDDLTQDEIDQIWAEAYQLYRDGEPLYLRGEEEEIARSEQHNHSERDDRRGIIENYINLKLPKGWDEMDIYKRRAWLEDPRQNCTGTEEREFVCAAEVWCECLKSEKSDMKPMHTKELNAILRSISNLTPKPSTKSFKYYGTQRYYVRSK